MVLLYVFVLDEKSNTGIKEAQRTGKLFWQFPVYYYAITELSLILDKN